MNVLLRVHDIRFDSVHTVFYAPNFAKEGDNTAKMLIYGVTQPKGNPFTEDVVPVYKTLKEYLLVPVVSSSVDEV